jgi:hypothetical protein
MSSALNAFDHQIGRPAPGSFMRSASRARTGRRVIYNRYKVTIVGLVPVQSASGETKLQFRIEAEIDRKAVRSRPRTMRPEAVEDSAGARCT